MDSSLWGTLPVRPEPAPGQLGGLNNIPGWLRNVSVQGITCEGYDHVAIEDVVIGLDQGVRLTVWNDDPVDYPPGDREAIVWTILPLAPDPALGMAINTRQSCVWYCEGARQTRLVANTPQKTSVRPWVEFIPPAPSVTRHGVWLTDAKWAEHVAAAPQARWGWMHAVEHLPDSETEIAPDGRRVLKEQRAQGRYLRSARTITYYQRDTDRVFGWGVFDNEDALELTTAASVTETVTTDANVHSAWGFHTPAGAPNSADWPSGPFNCQVNCTAASAGLFYAGNAANRGFIRASSDLATSLENKSAVEASFSGTGLKLSTASWDAVAGAATDRFGWAMNAAGDSHGDAITLTLNTTDSYADGPWGPTDTMLPGAGEFQNEREANLAWLRF